MSETFRFSTLRSVLFSHASRRLACSSGLDGSRWNCGVAFRVDSFRLKVWAGLRVNFHAMLKQKKFRA